MATSGSWDYSLTAAQVIQAAFEDLGAYAPGQTIGSADAAMALTRLNLLAKQWQTPSDNMPGLKIATRQRVTLILAKGQQTYTIGPATGDSRASTLIGRTTMRVTGVATDTVLNVTAITDTTSYPGTTKTMAGSDFVGIQLDDGTIQWTTISSTGAGPTMTIGAGGGLTSQSSAGWQQRAQEPR